MRLEPHGEPLWTRLLVMVLRLITPSLRQFGALNLDPAPPVIEVVMLWLDHLWPRVNATYGCRHRGRPQGLVLTLM